MLLAVIWSKALIDIFVYNHESDIIKIFSTYFYFLNIFIDIDSLTLTQVGTILQLVTWFTTAQVAASSIETDLVTHARVNQTLINIWMKN